MKVQSVLGCFDSNTFIVEHENTILIIEAGAPLHDVLQVLGSKKPSAILLTHEHFDHVMHIADYCKDFPDTRIYCHPATLEELKTNKLNGLLGSHRGFKVKSPPDFDNFKVLGDNQSFDIGSFKITPIFCQGHSAGSTVYLIGDALFSGDVLFSDTIGRTDLMPNGPELMQSSLKRLADIKFEIAYHGHYESSNYNEQQKNIRRFQR